MNGGTVSPAGTSTPPEVVQVLVVGSYMSTSLEGLGGTLPPPMTNIPPLKLNARVSPVALGIGAIDPMVLATRSKLNEFGRVYDQATLEI